MGLHARLSTRRRADGIYSVHDAVGHGTAGVTVLGIFALRDSGTAWSSENTVGSAPERGCTLNQMPWKLTAQLLLAASTIALFGTPVFIWLRYPRPSLAYESGAAWNMLTGLLVVGLAAALLSDFFVRRRRRRGATKKARLAASASGPAIVFAPSLAVAGLATGLSGAAFVFLVSAVAIVVFWLLTRRSRGCTFCRSGCRSM